MKYKILAIVLLMISNVTFSQKGNSLWKVTTNKNKATLASSAILPQKNLYDLEQLTLQNMLANAPQRFANAGVFGTVISLPNADGDFENFRVYENSVMDPALAERYPEIKSYIAIGVENPTSKAYISNSPLGFKSMVLSPGKSAVFIEPFSTDLTTYTVYKKSDTKKSLTPFECSVIEEASSKVSQDGLKNANDATLRTFRLAVSTTGEYTAFFGGSKAQALAAINASMTRVNGVFETDFAVRMVLIANNDLVIYTNASTDPYGTSYDSQLQSTLTSVIGEANYDVGHLFVRAANNGNAGCIGCICVNGSKGSGFTAGSVPTGDIFDIDYVAHEIGHQFGGNHTFSFSNEGTNVNMEPGSGSTIMGYAGITNQDVQLNSDAFFHAISIQQITNNVKNKTCQVNTPTGNAVPTANAGLDYTIPKSTPFMLTGAGTDANGDALTYNWEQIDNAASTATGTSSAATATRTTGPTFRSYNSSTSPVRYFPRLQSVLAGTTTTTGTEIVVEALSSVARNLKFRLTVRDNRAGGPANNSDDVLITVNATAGPFSVSAPNTAVTYAGNSSQTITWDVAGTTANGVNCANVDILLSTDAGNTWSTLLAATPNDGTQAVTIPNIAGTTNRIMVKGTNHIFFDVSNANFTITNSAPDTTAPSAATLSASGTTSSSTNLSWSGATDNIGVSGYDVYQDGVFRASTASTTFVATGLSANTAYSFYVIGKDAAGNVSPASNTVNVTTLTPDTTAPTAPTLSASGTTATTTNLSWTGATDNVSVTGYNVYRGTTLLGSTTTATTYAVTGLTASSAYTFYVQAKDAAGNVSPASNTVNVTTLTPSITYCISKGNNSSKEYINRVQLGTINNLSGNNTGYGNYTALSTNLVRSTSNTITITPAWPATKYSEAYRVWIDYNQDGDFLDSGEQVVNVTRTKTTPITRSFTLPTTALLGTTRMRVSMKYNASPTSCEVFALGEVEDYTVNITSTAKIEETNTSLSFNLYPNPVKGDVLNIANLELASEYRIFNMMGQELGKGKVENNAINVGSLSSGTYMIEISNGVASSTKRFIKE